MFKSMYFCICKRALHILLPLDVSISTVGRPKFMHQRWRGLTLTPTGDSLDLVGVHNMRYNIPTQKVAKITVILFVCVISHILR